MLLIAPPASRTSCSIGAKYKFIADTDIVEPELLDGWKAKDGRWPESSFGLAR